MRASQRDHDLILTRCREEGFALAGIAHADPTQYPEELGDWLARGKHGEMQYLQDREGALRDPGAVLPGARSVICVGDRYHDGEQGPSPQQEGPTRGKIARYARGLDYHRVIRRRLHRLCDILHGLYAGASFRACVDTAPVLEREYAQRAGLGNIGKHTLLIEESVGSYLLLGEILSTLAFDEECLPRRPSRDPCGSCTRCIDACPTGAITPWSVDARTCVSYLTIEHRSTIVEESFEGMGDWVFGCDICQEVCPHNQPTTRSRGVVRHEDYAPARDGFDLLDILGWSEEDRRNAFLKTSMKRAKLGMMQRNALIAAGNALREGTAGSDREALTARIKELARGGDTVDSLVSSTARAVLGQLVPRG